MPDSGKSRVNIARVVLVLLALGVAAIIGWPHPRGIYGTDYGFPLRVVTVGAVANFDGDARDLSDGV